MGDGEALLCFSKSPRRCRRGLRNEFLSSQNVSAFTLPITTLKKKNLYRKPRATIYFPPWCVLCMSPAYKLGFSFIYSRLYSGYQEKIFERAPSLAFWGQFCEDVEGRK